MRHETYWPHLARLMEWAAEFVPTVLLSCLSSHASVLLFDGIERRRRQIKCSGVFPGRILDPDDPLAVGLPEHLMVPHSRLNEVPQSALVEAGYRVVVGDAGAGVDWSVAARERGRSLFVLCQGHPEYDTLSLLREYRRDVRRYLLSKGGYGYPRLPDGYLSASATSQLEDFARAGDRRPARPQAPVVSLPISAGRRHGAEHLAAGVDDAICELARVGTSSVCRGSLTQSARRDARYPRGLRPR